MFRAFRVYGSGCRTLRLDVVGRCKHVEAERTLGHLATDGNTDNLITGSEQAEERSSKL